MAKDVGINPICQWDSSRLPEADHQWDNSPMAADVATPLTRYLHQRMAELSIGQKEVALRAGLGDTYVRDILKGRSVSPQVGKLAKIAEVLAVPLQRLLQLTTAADPAEVVKDAAELVLLRAWRQLPDREREGVLRFIEFHLAEAAATRTARE
jgi:transcriptional regulator with XRE-family HTH domain